MDYITIFEMAEKWNISERMIRRYCIDGRIEGTIFEDNAWLIPEDAQKPLRKKKEAPALPILVKKLQRQRTKKIYHGLYDYIQINFCYSSNRLASNRLMLNQVEEVYKKGKVSTGFEPIKVEFPVEGLGKSRWQYQQRDLGTGTYCLEIQNEYIQNRKGIVGEVYGCHMHKEFSSLDLNKAEAKVQQQALLSYVRPLYSATFMQCFLDILKLCADFSDTSRLSGLHIDNTIGIRLSHHLQSFPPV